MKSILPSVFSMFSVKTYNCDVPHIVISVRSPGGEKAELPVNQFRLGVLYMEFHDIDDAWSVNLLKSQGVDPVPFDERHADDVLGFLSEHDGAEAIICNCEAGISRSAGIAAAISKFSTGDDEEYFRRYRPNMFVYRRLLDIMHERYQV